VTAAPSGWPDLTTGSDVEPAVDPGLVRRLRRTVADRLHAELVTLATPVTVAGTSRRMRPGPRSWPRCRPKRRSAAASSGPRPCPRWETWPRWDGAATNAVLRQPKPSLGSPAPWKCRSSAGCSCS